MYLYQGTFVRFLSTLSLLKPLVSRGRMTDEQNSQKILVDFLDAIDC